MPPRMYRKLNHDITIIYLYEAQVNEQKGEL